MPAELLRTHAIHLRAGDMRDALVQTGFFSTRWNMSTAKAATQPDRNRTGSQSPKIWVAGRFFGHRELLKWT